MQNKQICQFYTKTGGCKYFNSCQKIHEEFAASNTIVLEGVVPAFRGINNKQVEENFIRNVYEDIYLYCAQFGIIKRAEVATNRNHLYGNFYVQFQDKDSASKCLEALNAQFYAGRQIKSKFCKPFLLQGALCNRTACNAAACCFVHAANMTDIQVQIRRYFSKYRQKDSGSL